MDRGQGRRYTKIKNKKKGVPGCTEVSRLHSIYSTLLVMQQPLLKHLKETEKGINCCITGLEFSQKGEEIHHGTA